MGQIFMITLSSSQKSLTPNISAAIVFIIFSWFLKKSNNFGLRDRQLHLQGLERYFAVCHLKKMNFKTAFIILGSIVPLSIIMSLPVAWWFEWHINDNGTVIMVSNSEFILDSKFYVFSFYAVVKIVLPMLILIITSILTIKKVPKINLISNNSQWLLWKILSEIYKSQF